MPSNFAKALVVAIALHGAGAAVMAWCVAFRVLPVAGTGTCSVEVFIDPPAPVQSSAVSVPRAVSTPSLPHAVVADRMVEPLPDLPVVPAQKNTEPESVATSPAPSPVREGVARPSPSPVVAMVDVSPGVQADSGVVAGSGIFAETNPPVRARNGFGADAGLVVTGIVRPRYPASARMRGEQGLVTVTVDTDDDGRAREVTVTVASGFPALDRAAVDAARRARFVSAIAGAPARGKALLSFRFNLVD